MSETALKMNIYEKMQECRAQLMMKDLKQTGLNKFSNYTYFELGDFLPKAIEIMKNLKMTGIFGFESNKATLTIVNAEKTDECIEFSTPSLIPELKGSNAIQNIGAAQTYMRRYLYTMALELSDFDMVNSTEPTEEEVKKLEKEIEEITTKKVNETQLKAIQAELTRTGVKEKQITAKYKIDKLQDMDFIQWQDCMRSLEITKTKGHEDLGLE